MIGETFGMGVLLGLDEGLATIIFGVVVDAEVLGEGGRDWNDEEGEGYKEVILIGE